MGARSAKARLCVRRGRGSAGAAGAEGSILAHVEGVKKQGQGLGFGSWEMRRLTHQSQEVTEGGGQLPHWVGVGMRWRPLAGP